MSASHYLIAAIYLVAALPFSARAEEDVPASIQERAYTLPIRYTPLNGRRDQSEIRFAAFWAWDAAIEKAPEKFTNSTSRT